MTEALIAVASLLIGLSIGATVMMLALYPQLILLRSMLIDRQAAENKKTGVKVSAIEKMPAEVAEKVSDKPVHTNLLPPDLFALRRDAEKAEAEVIKRRKNMMELAENM